MTKLALVEDGKIIDILPEEEALLSDYRIENWIPVDENIQPSHPKTPYTVKITNGRAKVTYVKNYVPQYGEPLPEPALLTAENSQRYIPVNEHLFARIATFADGTTYERPAASEWFTRLPRRLPEKFSEKPTAAFAAGAKASYFSHISLVVSGWMRMTFFNGHFYDMLPGESSEGLIPDEPWTREFHDGYTQICMLFNKNVPQDINYDFQILHASNGETLNLKKWDVAFLGKGQIEGIKEGVLDVSIPLKVEADSYVIVGKRA